MPSNFKFCTVFCRSWINLYELATLKRRKTFTFSTEIPTPEVEFMSFTYDSKGIAVLSKEPDAFLTIFFMDKAETVVVGRVSNSGQKAVTAHYISCNLSDTGLVAIGGKKIFVYILIILELKLNALNFLPVVRIKHIPQFHVPQPGKQYNAPNRLNLLLWLGPNTLDIAPP